MVLHRRYLAGLLLFLFCGMLFAGTILATDESLQGTNPVILYRLSGQITGATTLSIQEVISLGQSENARLIIIELSTTGGELGAVNQIIQLFATSPIPVVVYVPPAGQAISGGTYLLTAAHVAVMGPAARIGSCQPVTGLFPITDPLYLNSLLTLLTTQAHVHERNETTATHFILENLNLGAVEAEAFGSVEFIANSLPELLETLEAYTLVQRDLTEHHDYTFTILPTTDLSSYNYSLIIQDFDGVATEPQINYSPNTGLTILAFLANPIVSFILLQVGIWGFIFALNAPGHAGEIISIICILLALVGLGIIGISIAGIVLMVLGLVMLIIEAKTDVGFAGMAGAVGIACFILGGIFFLPPSQWLIPTQVMWLFQGFSAATAMIFSALFGYAVYKAAEARRLTSDFDPSTVIGSRGIAETNLDPVGRVRALGESWMAEVEKGVIKAGESIEVVRLDGIRLIVKKSDIPDEF
ncbi:MAG: nodulation protein NfeD [Candidatus Thorarchaeota archaeon]